MNRMYWDDIEAHFGREHLDAIWMSHPTVRARLNERISGKLHTWPLQWFKDRMGKRLRAICSGMP